MFAGVSVVGWDGFSGGATSDVVVKEQLSEGALDGASFAISSDGNRAFLGGFWSLEVDMAEMTIFS